MATDEERDRLRGEIMRFTNPSDRLHHLEALGLCDDPVVRAEVVRIHNAADLVNSLAALGYC